ncbi:MAG: RtcB family protein [Candidatus Obscuribacterales bacterium]|nr:RtcB family protein [Candidatus Obscuribacterales bacterium]
MSKDSKYVVFQGAQQNVPIKAWINGVSIEDDARQQLINISRLPFIYKWIAAMPDVHLGKGATVGSVIPTLGAIIPAAVGVDIGCGMMASRTTLKGEQLPDNLRPLRDAIERAVPHGRTDNGGKNDRGAWHEIPLPQADAWQALKPIYEEIVAKHPKVGSGYVNHVNHLGTLGTGNHFIELCLDQDNQLWIMLHSGSRGIGNRIGSYFIDLAREDMRRWFINLPDQDLAYFPEGTEHFNDYFKAVSWAQNFARTNRKLMMDAIVAALRACPQMPDFELGETAVNCHHNYVSREGHYGQNVFVTRKGAVSAREGELGIIPGSMGACSYIVRGKGNQESFHSCSHGAGRSMSRTEAKKRFSLEDHKKATEGVECRKDEDVIDETPAAYKPIDAVMDAQKDLVEVVHKLKQIVCVKG